VADVFFIIIKKLLLIIINKSTASVQNYESNVLRWFAPHIQNLWSVGLIFCKNMLRSLL